ncbi:hypothetical protein VS_II1197 [Vibrio atlanticus]|uniref:Uncharacterized protein n=1 Tax=Vibrio atlanticus (strain LGP32) TaxID=575788 RepID=B7VSW1_VIBA3|nr:hypothetical protein VS_II1197 [Vibrio atlanticus]
MSIAEFKSGFLFVSGFKLSACEAITEDVVVSDCIFKAADDISKASRKEEEAHATRLKKVDLDVVQ